jgi:APA family basic amino acid/polyamine antiporter
LVEGKGISVKVATAVGLGAIIGAGIFVLSGTAIAIAGPDALIAFLLVGIVALLIAFEFGALGFIMPNAKGAAYSYVYEAFGSELGFITGILAYFSFATAISAIALGFGSYMASMLGLPLSQFSILFAIMLIFVLTLVNIIGVKKAAKADFWLVMLKLSILGIFIAFALGIVTLGHYSVSGHFSILKDQSSIAAIFAASVAIFFAYSGFQSISTITSSVEGKAKGASKAIISAVIISIIVYVFVALALMFLAPASAYTISADPLSFALKFAHAPVLLFIVVDIGALIATTSATLAMILSSSRILYQISDNKLLPKIFRKYDKKKDVAVNGVIISSIIGVVMLFSGNIYVIAAISNFGLLFSYLMGSFAVIHFKRIKKEAMHIPFYPALPVIAIVAILAFLIGMPKEALVIGTGIIMSLMIIYYFLRELRGKKIIRIRLFK